MNQSHTTAVQHLLGVLSIASTVLSFLAPIVPVIPGPAGLIAGAVLGGASYVVSALGKAFLPPAPGPSVMTVAKRHWLIGPPQGARPGGWPAPPGKSAT